MRSRERRFGSEIRFLRSSIDGQEQVPIGCVWAGTGFRLSLALRISVLVVGSFPRGKHITFDFNKVSETFKSVQLS